MRRRAVSGHDRTLTLSTRLGWTLAHLSQGCARARAKFGRKEDRRHMVKTGINATNLTDFPEIIVRAATGEIGMIAGETAIYVRREDLERLIDALRGAREEIR